MPTEEDQKRFLDLCAYGDLESIQELLTKDPLLIKSKDHNTGKFQMYTSKSFTNL